MKSILSSPLTFVIAGSGFGKTTAVSCFLEDLSEEICRWYTCFGEPPERAWSGICTLLSFADPHTAEFLSKINAPTVDSLGHIFSLMDGLSCSEETILVIDNYQLSGFANPYHLLDALAAHHCKNLHIVVLSQPIQTEKAMTVSNPRIIQIPQNMFSFQPDDIQKLFSIHCAKISIEEAEMLYSMTEGWAAALQLHLSQFLDSGLLKEHVGIGELIERAFWGALTDEYRGFFLGLSLLNTFTEAQASRILGEKTVPDALWSLVLRNPFVHRDESEYTLHGLLKEFLSAKMLAQSDEFRRIMWNRAGGACVVQGKNVEAVLFFIQSGDDEAALAVALSSVQIAELVRTKPDQLTELFSRCPTRLLTHRWQLLLGAAIKASLNEKIGLARTAINRLTELRELPDGGKRQSAAAALELIASFQAFNDVADMCRHHAAVYELLDDPRDFHLTNDAWTFSTPSAVYMFWREWGKLAKTIQLLEEGIPRYAIIAGGKGLGSSEVMRAEALLLSGDEVGCEAVARQAKFIAAEHDEDSICFCALTLLARVALLQSDARHFFTEISAIELLAFEGKEFRCVTASEVSLGYLYSLLDIEEKIPNWLFRMDAIRQELYPVSVPFAHIITLRWLRRHKAEDFIGAAEAFIKESQGRHHLLPVLYAWLEQAAYYEQAGSRDMALGRVGQALSHALLDEVYLPIAEYYAELSEVLEDPALTCADTVGLERVCSLGKRFASGVEAVRAVFYGISPLTPREREVAMLAKQRLSTREIAAQLVISQSTVKNTLNKIYSKLNIHRKSDLMDTNF